LRDLGYFKVEQNIRTVTMMWFFWLQQWSS